MKNYLVLFVVVTASFSSAFAQDFTKVVNPNISVSFATEAAYSGGTTFKVGFLANNAGDPMGLAVEDGVALNLNLNKGFGILIVGEDGSVELSHGDEMSSREKINLTVDGNYTVIQLQSVIRNEVVAILSVDDREEQHFIAETTDGNIEIISFVGALKTSEAIKVLFDTGDYSRVLKLGNDNPNSPAILRIN